MIGASKIDNLTDDLIRLHEMFDAGLNNSQISKIYRTNKGERLSRIHISQIRNGKRWNRETHSFLMKDDLSSMESIQAKIGYDTFKTEIAMVITSSKQFYIYITYKNGKHVEKLDSPIMLIKPNITHLTKYFEEKVINEHSKGKI